MLQQYICETVLLCAFPYLCLYCLNNLLSFSGAPQRKIHLGKFEKSKKTQKQQKGKEEGDVAKVCAPESSTVVVAVVWR